MSSFHDQLPTSEELFTPPFSLLSPQNRGMELSNLNRQFELQMTTEKRRGTSAVALQDT